MKKITNKTIIRQVDKIYQPVEIDGVIYWTTNNKEGYIGYFYDRMMKSIHTNNNVYSDYIVAQSQPKLEGIPVVSFDKFVISYCHGESIGGKCIYPKCKYDCSSHTETIDISYTQQDIEKAILLGRRQGSCVGTIYTNEEILEQINSISLIEVDEQFNIINYE